MSNKDRDAIPAVLLLVGSMLLGLYFFGPTGFALVVPFFIFLCVKIFGEKKNMSISDPTDSDVILFFLLYVGTYLLCTYFLGDIGSTLSLPVFIFLCVKIFGEKKK